MENYDSEWSPEEEDEEEDEGDEELSDEELEDINDALTEEEELEQLEEELLVREALVEFSFKFSEYIREMDPELWKRAVDYAVTFTKVEGVEFSSDLENGATGNSEEPPTT